MSGLEVIGLVSNLASLLSHISKVIQAIENFRTLASIHEEPEFVPKNIPTPLKTNFITQPSLPTCRKDDKEIQPNPLVEPTYTAEERAALQMVIKPAMSSFLRENRGMLQRANNEVIHTSLPDKSSITRFLAQDLDVHRLDILKSTLRWAAESESTTPALHLQLGELGPKVIATERADLHMLWEGLVLYLKPLPDYLLSAEYWSSHLISGKYQTWRNAMGLLASYIDLIQSSIDFDLAIDTSYHPRLLPKSVIWKEAETPLSYEIWREIVLEITATYPLLLLDGISAGNRWQYGTLNISRLNAIYTARYVFLNPLQSAASAQQVERRYYSRPNYNSVPQRNIFAWVVFAFAYISLILAAMQVGQGTSQLAKDSKFINACFGFAVFTMIAPLVLALLVIFRFDFMLLAYIVFDVYISASKDFGLSIHGLMRKRTKRSSGQTSPGTTPQTGLPV